MTKEEIKEQIAFIEQAIKDGKKDSDFPGLPKLRQLDHLNNILDDLDVADDTKLTRIALVYEDKTISISTSDITNTSFIKDAFIEYVQKEKSLI